MNTTEIQRIASNFLSDSKIKPIGTERGEYNEAYLFSAQSGEYVLRTKKKPIQIVPTDIAYEVEFMEKLAAAQTAVQIPKTIRTKSGDLLFEGPDAYYNLQTRVPGSARINKWYESHLLTVEDIEELFSTLARLHNVCRGMKMTRSKRSSTVFELLVEYRASLERKFPDGPFRDLLTKHRAFLLEKIRTVEGSLSSLRYEPRARYPVHYDMSACNVLWEKGKILSLIDFDWVQEATLEFDFARSVMETCGGYMEAGNSNNALDARKLHAALHSYNAASDVPFENRELTERIVEAASLFLAFWGVHTFLEARDKESYFMGFFRAGLDRLGNPVQFA